jgi:tetratricopeptide (TPR) repeat protein
MSKEPRIITFYSYKGGVGRSMAVLNVAYAMASRGRNVLVLDLDLEAPGLSGFLHRNQHLGQPARYDMIDLLKWAANVARAGQPIDEFALPPSEDYIVQVPADKIVSPDRLYDVQVGRIDFVPVDEGRDCYDRLTDLHVGGFDRDDLIQIGSVLRTWLNSREFPLNVPDYYGPQAQRSSKYDFVLVDSRTGITEIGGLCIGPLSDQLVVLTALNDQNVNGTKNFLKEVGILGDPNVSENNAERRLDPKPTIIVASPVPIGEIETKRKRLAELKKAVGHVVVKLSYHPQQSLMETIFVRDWPDEYLTHEYLQLVERITSLQRPPIPDTDLQKFRPKSKEELRDYYRQMLDQASASEADSTYLAAYLVPYFQIEDKDDIDYIYLDQVLRYLSRSGELGNFRWAAWRIDVLFEWAEATKDKSLQELRYSSVAKLCLDISESSDADDSLKAKVLNNRGVAFARLGRHEEAIAVCDDVVNRFADRPELQLAKQVAGALVNKGWVYYTNKQWSLAIDCFERAIVARPADVNSIGNLAVTLLVSGRTVEAMPHYDRAIELADAKQLEALEKDLRDALQQNGEIAGSATILAKIEQRQRELSSGLLSGDSQ